MIHIMILGKRKDMHPFMFEANTVSFVSVLVSSMAFHDTSLNSQKMSKNNLRFIRIFTFTTPIIKLVIEHSVISNLKPYIMKAIKFILFAATILFVHAAISQTGAPPLPTKGQTVEGITQYKLANGMKVLLFPDPSKATVTVNIVYLVGSRHEGYGETGMAHLLEHMAFKGSPKHKNIPQELTTHGSRPNGTTWVDRTNYFETVPATDENLAWALDLESDRMVNSYIAKKDLESEF